MMTRLNSYDISVYLCGSCLIDPLVFLSVPNPDQPVSFSAEPDPWWCAGSSTRSVHPNLGSAAATMLRVSVPHRNHSLRLAGCRVPARKAERRGWERPTPRCAPSRPVPSRREMRRWTTGASPSRRAAGVRAVTISVHRSCSCNLALGKKFWTNLLEIYV